MAKPSETAQIEFIKDLLRQGQKRNVILGMFGKKWEKVSRTTFDRRLKQATDAMDSELEQIKQRTDESVTREIEARKLKIMTVAERIDLLVRIANGEVKVKKPFVIAGKIMEYPAEPDFNERAKAIAELNKMGGDYAPSKVNMNINKIGIDAIEETYE